jgi:hypothetical protein
MTDDTFTKLIEQYQDRKHLIAQVLELSAENIALRKRVDALARELHLEKIHLDALLACTMPEDTCQ